MTEITALPQGVVQSHRHLSPQSLTSSNCVFEIG